MPIELTHSYETEDTNTSTNSQTETSTEIPRNDSSETPTQSQSGDSPEGENGSSSQTETDFYSSDEDEKVINSKEDIKYFIDKSKNSQELYENAIKVLSNLEWNFQTTLRNIAREENWGDGTSYSTFFSSFDGELNTDDPKTLFEKKGKELLDRAKTIQENLRMQNAGSQTIGSEDLQGIDDNEKNKLVEELLKTRADAIQNFKDDISDGLLSNENNISQENLLNYGMYLGRDLFELKETDKTKFEEMVNNMGLNKLILSTFNIEEGSGAFTYCYGKLKEKLGNKNLFDFIDEESKPGDGLGKALKYSAFKMLFQRRITSDLTQMIDGYSGDKEGFISFVKENIKKNNDFKISFLTSIKDLENSKYFGDIVQDLKQNDPDIKRAYEATLSIDNMDIFKDKKVNGLMIYDDEGHGGGSTYFEADFKDYQKNGFTLVSKEEKNNYKKYVLKKGNDIITEVKLKMNGNDDFELDDTLKALTDGQDYNLFALRGHCYNTGEFAETLGSLGVVGEGDLLIDGGCNNAISTRSYYNSGVKGHICAYTATGKGASTQAFIDRIINAKNSGKNFSDVLGYYNGLTTDSGRDGYFAFNTERPDSVSAQYKKLTKRENGDAPNNLAQNSTTPAGEEIGSQVDIDPNTGIDSRHQTETHDA